MSAEACSVQMYTERREALKDTASLAVVGLVPMVGDVTSDTLKLANKALQAGDLEQASKLINDASHEINVKWVDENAGMSSRARDYNDSASGARSNIDTQKGQAPTIDRIDEAGKNRAVRFDGDVMIDRKISVVTTPKAKNQAIR